MGIEHIARVNPKYFAAIELFMAKCDVRYYLNGIYIEPHREKGVVIVATNGRTLAAFHDPDGWAEKAIIVGGISKQLISACCTKGTNRIGGSHSLFIGIDFAVVTSQEGTPESAFDAHNLYAGRIELVDAKYPDWKRVVEGASKSGADRGAGAINPDYLALLSKVLYRLNRTKYGCVRAYGSAAFDKDERGSTSTVFRLDGADIADRFVALLMPIRDSLPLDKPLPDAFAPIPLPAPKAKPRLRHTASGWVDASTLQAPEVANV